MRKDFPFFWVPEFMMNLQESKDFVAIDLGWGYHDNIDEKSVPTLAFAIEDVLYECVAHLMGWRMYHKPLQDKCWQVPVH